MFGFNTWKARKLYSRALNGESPSAVLQVAEQAIAWAYEQKEWPLTSPSRDEFLGRMYGCLGIAYRELRHTEQWDCIALELEANKQAVEFLQNGSAEDLVIAHANSAASYLGCEIGDYAQNIELGLYHVDQAISLGVSEGEALAQLLIDRARFYMGRQKGNVAENKKTALENCKLALSKLPKNCSKGMAILVNYTLADIYSVIHDEYQSEHVEKSISIWKELLESGGAHDQDKLAISLYARIAGSYLGKIKGKRGDNIELALTYIEEGLTKTVFNHFANERAELLELLGDALRQRTRGQRESNLDRAQGAYAQAMHLSSSHVGSVRANLNRHEVLWEIADAEAADTVPKTPSEKHKVDPQKYIQELKEMVDSISMEDEPGTWAGACTTLADAMLKFGLSAENVGFQNRRKLVPYLEDVVQAYLMPVPYYEKNFLYHALANNFLNVANSYALLANLLDAADIDWDDFSQLHELRAPDRSNQTRYFYEKAIEFCHQAAKAAEKTDDDILKLKIEAKLGDSYVSIRDWKSAAIHFEKSLPIAQVTLADPNPNIQEVKHILSLLGTVAHWGPLAGFLSDGWKKAVEIGESSRAQFLAKALSFNSLPFTENERRDINGHRSKILELEQVLDSPMTFDKRTPLEQLIEVRQKLHEELRGFPLQRRLETGLMATLESIVGDGTVIIYPVITTYSGTLLVISNGPNRLRVDAVSIGDEIDLAQLLDYERFQEKRWREEYETYRTGVATETDWHSFVEDLSTEVSNSIISPLIDLLEEVTQEGNRKLHFISNYLFDRLPLSVAPVGPLGAPLLEHFEISFAPSIMISQFRKHDKMPLDLKKSSVAAIFTEPNPKQEQPLPYAPVEARMIAKSGSSGVLVDVSSGDLSEDQILSVLEGNEVWHFCSHYRVDTDEPMSSSIFFDPTALSLKTIFNHKGLKAPRFVVLSACNSSRSESGSIAQELVGLPSAFLQLGVEAVVAAQWPVDDIATTLLMGKFYMNWSEHTDIRVALRQAQFWLRDLTVGELHEELDFWTQGQRMDWKDRDSILQSDEIQGMEQNTTPFAHPVYWGAFCVYGS
ncbi:MAG: hypothetical protein COB93_04660 [Sneathiella sp.]|nr:MAG: hypothetical protein COB93_04660 [Sneathiella sp.]